MLATIYDNFASWVVITSLSRIQCQPDARRVLVLRSIYVWGRNKVAFKVHLGSACLHDGSHIDDEVLVLELPQSCAKPLCVKKGCTQSHRYVCQSFKIATQNLRCIFSQFISYWFVISFWLLLANITPGLYHADISKVMFYFDKDIQHGPVTRYVKLQGVHAPGMPGTFSPTLLGSDPDMHHGTCMKHVTWCMPWSLSCGFPWSPWRGKHSRCMHNPHFTYLARGPWTTGSF